MSYRHGSSPVLSTEAMRAADRATIEDFGVPGFALMETAARGAFAAIEERYGPSAGLGAIVLAGKGNNGGDALALARMLSIAGARVLTITLAGAENATGDCAHNLKLLEALEDDELCLMDIEHAGDGLNPWEAVDNWRAGNGQDRAEICVDGLLGIGAKAAFRGAMGDLAELTGEFDAVVSLDVPSGIHSDTGAALDSRAVEAEMTVAMGALKPGLLLGQGRRHAGEVVVVDIGIPPSILARGAEAPGGAWVLGDSAVAALLPVRAGDEHKFSAGQLVVVAGSERYPGAAVLACRAAARAGAGYVTCLGSPRTVRAIDSNVPDVACIERGSGPAASSSEFPKAAAILAGPGLADDAGPWMESSLMELQIPAVFDADALNAIAERGLTANLKKSSAGRFILTPHRGEMDRLIESFGEATPEGLSAIEEAALWSERLGCVLVLKGSPTIVADPSGTTFVAPSVETGLATAGSGDTLAGMIGGLLAQGMDSLDAAIAGVHIGLAAAASACDGRSSRGMIASDITEALPEVLRERFGDGS